MTDLEPIPPERAVELYLQDREPELAKSSLQNHRYRLERFQEWCADIELDNMNNVTGRTIHDYKTHRWKEDKVNTVTLRNHLYTIRAFLRWCESIDAVQAGIYEKVVVPSLDPHEAERDEMIPSEDGDEILDYLSTFEYASLRHIIFYLLWHAGLRTGSVRGIDIDDYHSHHQYVEIRHRPESGTPLKNKAKGEREVNLKADLCEAIDDYVAHQRPDVTDKYGREPLLATTSGRINKSNIQKHAYLATRPCYYSDQCPYDRDPDDCEAASYQYASRCPSSVSPHALRRSAITAHLNQDVPKEIASDRMDVSIDVLEKHYDARSEAQKRELRRSYLDNI